VRSGSSAGWIRHSYLPCSDVAVSGKDVVAEEVWRGETGSRGRAERAAGDRDAAEAGTGEEERGGRRARAAALGRSGQWATEAA
jgi:hypothetical protein